ncbi:MAG: hypothetical protein ACRD6W_19500, partial [Nitrososphaerales archaeon]
YHPRVPVRRPGAKPTTKPRFRVLIRRKYEGAWRRYVLGSGVQSAQQCWDHLAWTPDSVPRINSSTKLRGKNFRAKDGFSAVIHYRVGSAARVDYRYNAAYTGGAKGDPHGVVFIEWVGRSSAGT